jgi:23S rRNA (guanosine2251-2'-O)-methyltransferase
MPRNSLMNAVDELHLNGIKVYASEMNASTTLFDLSLTDLLQLYLAVKTKESILR